MLNARVEQVGGHNDLSLLLPPMHEHTQLTRDFLLAIERTLDSLLATPVGARLVEQVREVAAYETRIAGGGAPEQGAPLEGAYWRVVIRAPEAARAYKQYRLLRAMVAGAGEEAGVALLDRCPDCGTQTVVEADRLWCLNPDHPVRMRSPLSQGEIAGVLRGEQHARRPASPAQIAADVEALSPILLDVWALREGKPDAMEGEA